MVHKTPWLTAYIKQKCKEKSRSPKKVRTENNQLVKEAKSEYEERFTKRVEMEYYDQQK